MEAKSVIHEHLRNYSVDDYLPDDTKWTDIPRDTLLFYVKKICEQLPPPMKEDPLVMAWFYRSYNLVEEAAFYETIYKNEIEKTLSSYQNRVDN